MKKVLVAALALVAIGIAVPMALGAPAPKATGGVDWTAPGGSLTGHTSFTAQGTPLAATGQVQYQDSLGTQFHGVVDCFNETASNEAVFSGTITNGNATDTYFLADVIDNGTPGTAGPDQIGVQTSASPFDCGGHRHHIHIWDVTNGNLDVH